MEACPALPTQSSASSGSFARTSSPRPSGRSMNTISDRAISQASTVAPGTARGTTIGA